MMMMMMMMMAMMMMMITNLLIHFREQVLLVFKLPQHSLKKASSSAFAKKCISVSRRKHQLKILTVIQCTIQKVIDLPMKRDPINSNELQCKAINCNAMLCFCSESFQKGALYCKNNISWKLSSQHLVESMDKSCCIKKLLLSSHFCNKLHAIPKMQAQLGICNRQVFTPFAFIGGGKFFLGLCLFWWSFVCLICTLW